MPGLKLTTVAGYTLAALGAALLVRLTSLPSSPIHPGAGLRAFTFPTSGDVCPLTPAEEQDAIEKFDRMWPVIRHPRCLNCHGGVRPRLPARRGNHLLGGQITGVGQIERCQECHGGLPGWDTSPEGFFFTGKSARDVCIQFKKFKATPLHFVMHVYNDNGGIPFTETTFKGDRGLNTMGQGLVEDATGRPFQVEPPGMSHGEFVQAASDWANAVGERGWKATEDCGCGRKKRSWTGTVTGVWNLDLGDMGRGTETTSANVRLEIDTTYAPAREVYWSSTSGEIQWSIEITGQCRASSSRMIPVGLGADENPMATLSEEPGPGGSRFTVGIGPWRDEHQPQFRIRCPGQPPFAGIPYSLGVWWRHELTGMVSADGKTLKGTYTTASPLGTATWTWDLQLDR